MNDHLLSSWRFNTDVSNTIYSHILNMTTITMYTSESKVHILTIIRKVSYMRVFVRGTCIWLDVGYLWYMLQPPNREENHCARRSSLHSKRKRRKKNILSRFPIYPHCSADKDFPPSPKKCHLHWPLFFLSFTLSFPKSEGNIRRFESNSPLFWIDRDFVLSNPILFVPFLLFSFLPRCQGS